MMEGKDRYITGKHPVLEGLKVKGIISEIFVQRGTEGNLKELTGEAEKAGIRVRSLDKKEMDNLSKGVLHQGVIARTAPFKYGEMDDIFKLALERGEDPLIVVLDHIEDPHNLGAIARSAEGSGAHGVIIPEKRSADITPTVYKVSSGSVFHIPVVKVINIANTVTALKERGVFAAGLDMAEEPYTNKDLTGPLALVVGAEGKGLSRLVKEKCDYIVSIPMMGKIQSLNASNAASVLLYEIRRQRDEGKI